MAYPEFRGVSSLKIQSIIVNFINYLTLKNVLHKSIIKEFLKSSNFNPRISTDKKSKEIISEFNELGGGLDEKWDEAYEWLEEISQILKTGPFSLDARQYFIDDAIIEYKKSNAGFEDELRALLFEECKFDEDWEFLIQRLKERPSKWNLQLIEEIYENHLSKKNILNKLLKLQIIEIPITLNY
ncbi:MAG: hypothetical protein ACTSR8_04965 [Promethearchaeota archaeon]